MKDLYIMKKEEGGGTRVESGGETLEDADLEGVAHGRGGKRNRGELLWRAETDFQRNIGTRLTVETAYEVKISGKRGKGDKGRRERKKNTS